MPVRVAQKWRPTLGLVISAVLLTVLALPLVGLFFFRLYENQLIRQTEAELIAQSAVLAAAFAREVREAGPGLPLGVEVPLPGRTQASAGREGRAEEGAALIEAERAVEPGLDLAADDILGRRPDALPAARPADPKLVAIGARLQELAFGAQELTLAGFRITDAHGVVIGGRGELGLSLAHVEEVAAALKGAYRSVLRTRIPNRPPPPLYSITRGTGVLVFAAMPAIVEGRVAGVVYASRTPANIVKHIAGEWRKFLGATLVVLAVTAAIGFVFWRAVSRPIHLLVARTAEVGRGNRDALAPLAHHGTREVALLSQSFVDMAERLNQRSDYLATFAAHVSHEMKTPLTAIKGAAELMRDASKSAGGMSAEERERFLQNIIADATRLSTMLQRLRELAAAENPRTEGTTTLAAVAARLTAPPNIRLATAGAAAEPLAISEENLAIVLAHLADNAAQHDARTLTLTARAEGADMLIEAADDGEGISQKNRERVFDAFFTTRRESGGTGMGLGIARAMLTAHRGGIEALPSERGARFVVRVPRAG